MPGATCMGVRDALLQLSDGLADKVVVILVGTNDVAGGSYPSRVLEMLAQVKDTAVAQGIRSYIYYNRHNINR